MYIYFILLKSNFFLPFPFFLLYTRYQCNVYFISKREKMLKCVIETGSSRCILNTCRCQFHTPTRSVLDSTECYSTFLIKDYVLFATVWCTVNTHAIGEGHQLRTPTFAPAPTFARVQHPLDAGLQDAKEAPSMPAVFLPFAWAGSILRRKLHRLLQRWFSLKRENVMPPRMELSP